MKSFDEFCSDSEMLEEGIMRSGAITVYGARSKKHGDEAVRAFRQAQQALRKGGPDVALEDRVNRIEQSLDHLFDGLIAQRQQIGTSVALDVVGHGLAATAQKER